MSAWCSANPSLCIPCPFPLPPQARGVQDILAVDVTPEMIAELERRVGTASTLGNEPGVRTWVGDILDVPAYQVGWPHLGASCDLS